MRLPYVYTVGSERYTVRMVSNDYVRGIFDGEGCIFFNGTMPSREGRNTLTVMITMTDFDVLYAVAEALNVQGIRTKLRIRPRTEITKKGTVAKTIGNLYVRDRDSILRFYELIGPFSAKHEARFAPAIAYLHRRAEGRDARNERDARILELREKGLTYAEIATELGIARMTVWNALTKHGRSKLRAVVT